LSKSLRSWCAALFLLLLVAGLPAGALAEAGILGEARRVAAEAGLDPGCPEWNDGGLPATFSYDPEGGTRIAETAVLLPAPAGEVAAILEDLPGWPEWMLTAPDGAPNIKKIQFDPGSGKGWVKVGKEKMAGVLIRERDGDALGLRIEMLGGKHMKDVFVEASVLAVPGCPDWSAAVVRIGWSFSLRARFFGGSIAKSIPALFLLAIRDDLAARVLDEAGWTEKVLGAPLRAEEGKRLLSAAPPPGGEGEEEWPAAGLAVLTLEPGAVLVGEDAGAEMKELARQVREGRKIDVEDWFAAFWEALGGTSRIARYTLVVEGKEGPKTFLVGAAPATVHYEIRLEEGSFEASFGPVAPPSHP